MVDDGPKPPDCFGQLEKVFPPGEDGLRTSPDQCMKCVFSTSCLRAAIGSPEGLGLQEEKVDQAYEHGLIGTLERWSRKKLIRKEIEAMTSKARSKQKKK
jgi:hypothetical protein